MATTPTPDTQPLDIEKDLVDAQRTMLREVHDLVAGMLEDAAKQAPAAPAAKAGPWARVVPNRTHRVVLLDGARGTGKTSLMLTLIRAWQGEDPSKHELAKSLGEQGQALRILEPLDFDPKPRDLPLYAWLVQAFEPVVAWIEDAHRVDTEGLRQAWTTLFESAVLSDVIGLDGRTLGDDLEMVVYQQTRGQKGWQALRRHWQRFLDQLLGVLEQVDRLPAHGMLVLPIDDLDMQPGQAKELLLALRLAWHPRLMLLLNGDSAHLTEVLTVELYGEEASVGRMPGLDEQKERREKARHLAEAVVQKTIAVGHRRAVPWVHIRAALKAVLREHETLEDVLAKWFEPRPKSGTPTDAELAKAKRRATTAEYLALEDGPWPDEIGLPYHASVPFYWNARGLGQDCWHWRDLRDVRSLGDPDRRLGDLVLNARDPDGLPYFKRATAGRFSVRQPVQLRIRSALRTFLSPANEWEFATRYRLEMITDSGESVGISRAVALARALLILGPSSLPLEARSPRVVWRRFRRTDHDLLIPLPSPLPSDVDDLHRYRALGQEFQARGILGYALGLVRWPHVPFDGNEEIRHQFEDGRWSLLQGLLQRSSDRPVPQAALDAADWRREMIVLMSAPEYGASADEQAKLIEAVRSATADGHWVRAADTWIARRHELLEQAIAESMPDASPDAVTRATAAFDEMLRAEQPDAPWYQEIEPEPLQQPDLTLQGVTFSGAAAGRALRTVNSATQRELAALLGARGASEIVAGRPFNDLARVSATKFIGPAALQKLRDHVAGG